MAKTKDYTHILRTDDPLYEAKKLSIQALNETSSRIRENEDKMYSKVYYSLSLIFAILIATFASLLSWLLVLELVILFLVLLLFPAKSFYRNKKELKKCRSEIIMELKKLKIPVEETF